MRLAQPQLVDAAGTRRGSTFADDNGTYLFFVQGSGSFSVKVDLDGPTGWRVASPASGSYTFTVSGADVTGKDIGYRPKP